MQESRDKATNVIVQLYELTDHYASPSKESWWASQYEDFPSFLVDKIQDKLEVEVDHIQIMCYSIVGHTTDTLTFEVNWYEDEV